MVSDCDWLHGGNLLAVGADSVFLLSYSIWLLSGYEVFRCVLVQTGASALMLLADTLVILNIL